MAETLEQRQLREQEESEKAIAERDAETKSMLGKDEYVVLAPYVTLRVKDGLGGVVVRGYNAGAVVKADDIDEDNLRHHVETRLLVPTDHRDAEFAVPAGTPLPAEPPNVPVSTGTPPEMLDIAERTRRNREASDKAQERSEQSSRSTRGSRTSSDKQSDS